MASQSARGLLKSQSAVLLAANDDLDDLFVTAEPKKPAASAGGKGLNGYLQLELAGTVANPDHWSKARARLELGSHGRLSDSVRWKATGRFDYDAVYDIEKGFYPSAVRHDQKHEFSWRETYLDVSAGNLEFRLGRQNVIWGEMVGLFFADVVSAKDMREFILPEFEILRIPQWAARAEYFGEGYHAEALWIPYATVDNVGKPCSEFFAFPPPLAQLPTVAPCTGGRLNPQLVFHSEEKPKHTLANSNFGLRASTLRDGWDLSAFAYRSFDSSPAYYRQIDLNTGVVSFTARHERINQLGATLAKDFQSFVLKGEAILTSGRKFSVTRLNQADGLVKQNTLDYVFGLNFTLPKDVQLNLQVFQRIFANHDPDIVPERRESGFTALVSGSPAHNVDAQLMLIRSLNRADWLLRPKLTWNFEQNWRWTVGADIFSGPPLGLFGQFANRDRIYTELRYSF